MRNICAKRERRISRLRVNGLLPLILLTLKNSIDMKTKPDLLHHTPNLLLNEAHKDKITATDDLHNPRDLLKNILLREKREEDGLVVLEARKRSSLMLRVVAI